MTSAKLSHSRIDGTRALWAFVALNVILGSLLILAALLGTGAINLALANDPLVTVSIVAACSLLVGGAGFALLYHLHFRSYILTAREAELLARYPDQPWMLNPEWAKGRINDPQIGRVILVTVFLLGWIGGIAFVGTVNFDRIMLELQSSPTAWAAAAFFALITASAINVSVKTALSWVAVGNGVLRLTSLPGRIGGRFTAKLETRLRGRPASGLQVDLICLRYLAKSADGSRRGDVQQVWSTTCPVAARQIRKSGQRLIIPISLDIDDGLPETDYQGGTIEWRLRVSSIGMINQALLLEWAVPIYELQKRNG